MQGGIFKIFEESQARTKKKLDDIQEALTEVLAELKELSSDFEKLETSQEIEDRGPCSQ